MDWNMGVLDESLVGDGISNVLQMFVGYWWHDTLWLHDIISYYGNG